MATVRDLSGNAPIADVDAHNPTSRHAPILEPIVANVPFTHTCRGIQAGTAGTATIVMADGNTVTDYPLNAGMNQMRATMVTSIGTAADLFAAL